jgi:hypothetical protein
MFGAKPRSIVSKDIQKINIPEEIKEDENKMKIKIVFDIPYDYHLEENLDVEIIGNFTEWIPQTMERLDGYNFRYSFTAMLVRGYKHRYQFLVNGNEHIDDSKKSSVNFTGSTTNYIMVPLL